MKEYHRGLLVVAAATVIGTVIAYLMIRPSLKVDATQHFAYNPETINERVITLSPKLRLHWTTEPGISYDHKHVQMQRLNLEVLENGNWITTDGGFYLGLTPEELSNELDQVNGREEQEQ
jgi:hypothetical protein